MCQYCGANTDQCGAQTCSRAIMTAEEKAVLVDKHNELRRKVAKGQESQGSPGPQPGASNMNELVWDDEVARVAQMWADQCPPTPHDDNRNMVDG